MGSVVGSKYTFDKTRSNNSNLDIWSMAVGCLIHMNGRQAGTLC